MIKEDQRAWNLTMNMADERDVWRVKLQDASRLSNTLGSVQRKLKCQYSQKYFFGCGISRMLRRVF